MGVVFNSALPFVIAILFMLRLNQNHFKRAYFCFYQYLYRALNPASMTDALLNCPIKSAHRLGVQAPKCGTILTAIQCIRYNSFTLRHYSFNGSATNTLLQLNITAQYKKDKSL